MDDDATDHTHTYQYIHMHALRVPLPPGLMAAGLGPSAKGMLTARVLLKAEKDAKAARKAAQKVHVSPASRESAMADPFDRSDTCWSGYLHGDQ